MRQEEINDDEELDENKYEVGILTLFSNLSEDQRDIFIKLISDDYSSLFQVLFNVIEDNDLVLEILDLLAGQRIQFPSRKKLYKLLEKIKIYTFVKSKGYSEQSCKLLAKQYNKRISQIKSAIDRIDYLLDGGKYKDIEKEK